MEEQIKKIENDENIESLSINEVNNDIKPVSDISNIKTEEIIKDNDIITKLPDWDLNPPLEINRGEK